MIRIVRFSNFYSFNGEQEINFLTNKKKTFDYFNSKNKESEQITKIAGFAGSNASGKTNVIRVLSWMQFFALSNERGGKDNINNKLDAGFKTFFNNKKKSYFYIEFEFNEKIFFYEFNIKENVILSEKLEVKDFTIKRKEKVFERKNKKNNQEFTFNEKYIPANLLTKKVQSNMKKDVSLISFLKSSYEIDIINEISEYFFNFITNINEKDHMDREFRELLASVRVYLKDKKYIKKLNNFIDNFDIGLKKVSIEKVENDKKFEIKIEGTHYGNKKVDWEYESLGTRSIFSIFAEITFALENNGTVLIDEMETGLHPKAVEKIIEYFINQNEKGKAQLIFSSHSLNFMSRFNSTQIFLVEKNEKSESEVYRLDSLKPRPEENLLAKYMTGAYGASPKITI